MYYRAMWLTAGSLLYRKGGDPQPWGCTPSVTNRARPDTAHSSGVLWGFNMGRGTGFLILSPAWQKCPVASRFAKNVGVNQVRHNYWKRGAYQIQPQGAGLAILSWLLFWNHFSYGFLWFVGFFLFVISASVPIPLPWHETCQGHNFSPSPLQSVSLAPNFWSTAIYSPISWVYLDFFYPRTHSELLGSLITNKGMEQHLVTYLKLSLYRRDKNNLQ